MHYLPSKNGTLLCRSHLQRNLDQLPVEKKMLHFFIEFLDDWMDGLMKLLNNEDGDLKALINVKSFLQETPLYLAIRLKKDPRLIKFLLERGADPSIQSTAKEETLLFYSISSFNHTLTDILLPCSPLQSRNWRGENVIVLAARISCYQTLQKLLPHLSLNDAIQKDSSSCIGLSGKVI